MSKPAARIGDMTAHGGSIVAGSPTVLIGGQPAARLTDMHVCPMVTPVGPVAIPHIGGPIVMIGSPTVLIGGLPAARIGDMAICIGPPDTIVSGCFTVLIGEAGGGGAGAGAGSAMSGVSGSPAGPAAISAGIAVMAGGPGGESGAGAGGTTDEGAEEETEEGHWIKFQFVDNADNSISGVYYEFTTPDGSIREGRLDADGTVRWGGADSGQGKVKLMDVSNARWSQEEAQVDDTVTMTADVDGYDPGTGAIFTVYERNVASAARSVAVVEAQTQGNKVEAQWGYTYPEDVDDASTDGGTQSGYSVPEYYFEVAVGQCKARSGLLKYKDYMEIELKDKEDNPFANEEYILYIPDGTVRKGSLDQNGCKREENLPAGYCKVRFPRLARPGQTNS